MTTFTSVPFSGFWSNRANGVALLMALALLLCGTPASAVRLYDGTPFPCATVLPGCTNVVDVAINFSEEHDLSNYPCGPSGFGVQVAPGATAYECLPTAEAALGRAVEILSTWMETNLSDALAGPQGGNYEFWLEGTIARNSDGILNGSALGSLLFHYGPAKPAKDRHQGSCKATDPADDGCEMSGMLRGNPFNIATGNKFQREQLIFSADEAGVSLSLYYNSTSVRLSEWGAGWSGDYSQRIVPLPGGTQAIARRPDGQIVYFNLDGSTWKAMPGVRAALRREPDRWVYVDENDTTELFGVDGSLTALVHRNGQHISIARNPQGRVSTVTDAFGRALHFEYNDAGLVREARFDQEPVPIRFTYDDLRNLRTITYQDGNSRTFIYDHPKELNALTGLVDESGVRTATYRYSSTGVFQSTELAGGVYAYSFQQVDAATTRVTDPFGTARTYQWQVLDSLGRLNEIAGGPCGDCGPFRSTTFGATSWPSQRVDWDANTTIYGRTDPLRVDLETSRTEAVGQTVQRSVETVWHTQWRLPTQMTVKNNLGATVKLTEMAYDDVHGNANPLLRRITDIASGRTRQWTWTRSYSPVVPGALVQTVEDGPRTDVSDRTTTDYYAADATDLTRRGRVRQITDALNHATQITDYNIHSQPTRMVDPNGLVLLFTYDLRQRLKTIDRGGAVTRFDYFPTGLLQKLTLPDGTFRSYSYDDAHRLTGVTDNLGNRTAWQLDAMGNRLREDVYGPGDVPATARIRAYDILNRLERVIGAANPTAEVTKFTYDDQGNLKTVTDPRSTTANPIVTTQFFDALNRLIQITDAAKPTGGITRMGYDALDQLTSVRAPNSATTTFDIDALGNTMREVSPDRGTVDATYDEAGNLRTRTDARGIVATYAYDALNRLVGVSYPDASENIVLKWDRISPTDTSCTYGVGRLCEVTDAGGTTRYAYDIRGNLTATNRIDSGVTYPTTFAYTLADRLALTVTPTAKQLTNTRDAGGRVGAVTGTVAGASVNFAQSLVYDAAQQVVAQRLVGQTQASAFDLDGRLTSGSVTPIATATRRQVPTLPEWASALLAVLLFGIVVHTQRCRGRVRSGRVPNPPIANSRALIVTLYLMLASHSALAYDTARQYDAAGNLLSRTNPAGTTTFTYDELSRLKSEAGPARTQTFSFDPNDNRTSDGAGGYSVVPNTNRYATLRGSAAAYDAAGNLTGGLTTGSPATAKSFVYNQAGRLKEVRQGITLLATYTYNAFGQRTRKALTAAGAQAAGLGSTPITLVFHYDRDGNLLAETTATGVPVRTWVWRESAQEGGLPVPVALIEAPSNVASGGSNPTAQERVYGIVADALATPRSLRDTQGREVWRWASDAFGATLPDEDPDGDGQKVRMPLRFPGQYFDAESGLHYNGYRTYDPASGRYLESDPIGLQGGINTYAYVGGNPVSFVDSMGLETCVLVTRMGVGFADHVALYFSRGSDFGGPAIYDPAGSYSRSIDPGNGDMITGRAADIGKFADFYKRLDGTSTDKTCKDTSKEEERRLFERALELGAQSGLSCARASSTVLSGSPYYRSVVPGTFFPGNLFRDAKKP